MIRSVVLISILAFCKAEVRIVAFTVAEDVHRNVSTVTTIPYTNAIYNNNAHVPAGVFTCDAAGLYKFQVYALTQTDEQLILDVYHNAKIVASLWAHTDSDFADAGNAVILDLVEGDTVQVKSRDGVHVSTFGSSDEIYSTFTGIQLGSHSEKTPIAFSVALSADQTVQAGAPVVYDHKHVDTANAYATTSGVFTAPANGIYVLHFFGMSQTDQELWQELYHNGDYVSSLYGETSNDKADAGNTAILHLKAGDQLQVKANSKTTNYVPGAQDELYSTFSGYLLVPENAIDTTVDGPVAYFSAGLSHNVVVPGSGKVVFDKVFSDHRDGNVNNYDPTTGVFTAPYSGVYEFNFHILGQSKKPVWLELVHGYKYVDSVYSHVPTGYGAAGNAAVIEMDAGDQAFIRARQDEPNALYGADDEVYCTFSGALLHARTGVTPIGK